MPIPRIPMGPTPSSTPPNPSPAPRLTIHDVHQAARAGRTGDVLRILASSSGSGSSSSLGSNCNFGSGTKFCSCIGSTRNFGSGFKFGSSSESNSSSGSNTNSNSNPGSSSIDVNRSVCGTTVLSLSLYMGNTDLFRTVLTHAENLDINKSSKDEKGRIEPPIVTATRLENHVAIKLLIDAGADLEAMDNFKHTALWMATRQRFADTVEYLIERGANVNPSKLWTHSPLYFAVKYSSKRADIAKLLIRHGAMMDLDGGGVGGGVGGDVGSTGSVGGGGGPGGLLYCSLIQGMVGTAQVLVSAGLNASRDARLRAALASGTLTRSGTLASWLGAELSAPAPLQRQCRAAVRAHVAAACGGRHFLPALRHFLARVPVPRGVAEYVTMEHEIQVNTTWDLKKFGEEEV